MCINAKITVTGKNSKVNASKVFFNFWRFLTVSDSEVMEKCHTNKPIVGIFAIKYNLEVMVYLQVKLLVQL
ncbi:hypothetical protein LBMAG29_08470 [Methylophilaceae bacterium]|nr:hypothetical protein LBMAG29_08470 [Methylophilaceae bacterium]